MVQILESPFAGISGGFGKGLSEGLSAGFKQSAEERKQREFLKGFLPPSAGDQLSLSAQKFNFLSPQQKALLALQDPKAFKAYEAMETGLKEEQEKVQKKEDLGNILNSMAETLEGGNLGKTPSRFATARGRRDAQYFDSLGVQLESIGKELVSKGVLSAPRFAYLLSNLPAAHKTDAANAGALEAWADELKLPRPEGLEQFYEKKSKKKSKSTVKKAGTVAFQDAEGNVYDIPSDKVEEARAAGFKPI